MDEFLPPVAVLMLSAVSLWITTALPQALEAAVTDANGSAAIVMYLEPGEQRAYPREIQEERPEPPIAEGIRAEGSMRA